VIVDLAAEQGGNCALTRPGEIVEYQGVRIIGALNLPASLPADASLMYAKNVSNLFATLFPKGSATPDFEDEVTRGTCIIRAGEIVNEGVKNALVREKKR
jgi:NAD(P) transhydrogenase subunit alpha